MFALPLWSVLSKLFLLPCMRRCVYGEYVLKEIEALGQGLIGCVGRFYFVQLPVAPFHYAIDGFPYTVWDRLHPAPVHYAQDKCFVTHPNSTALSIA